MARVCVRAHLVLGLLLVGWVSNSPRHDAERCERPTAWTGGVMGFRGEARNLLRRLSRQRVRTGRTLSIAQAAEPPKIGLALGGGFARGIAHTGVLKVFEREGIPIHCVTGVSAGSIVAAAYASGASPDEIARAGCAMRFGDVASWSLCRMGFVVSERMKRFLERLLKAYRFEDMRMPLGIIATD